MENEMGGVIGMHGTGENSGYKFWR